MKSPLILLALLTSVPAMGQQGGARGGPCADSSYVGDHRYECERAGQDARRSFDMNSRIPVHLLVIPQAWWTDQGNPEIACYHYDSGPYRDRLIDWCLAKVRGAK